MDKDRFEKIAIEAQPHLDALERIAKREQMGIVSIALYGKAEVGYGLETSMSYMEGYDLYNCNRYDDGKTKIRLIGDDYRNTYVYEKSKEV